VAPSIYDACHYFRLFQTTTFGRFCGIITSYEPNHNAISREPKDSDERYKFDTYTQHVLSYGQTTTHYRRPLGTPGTSPASRHQQYGKKPRSAAFESGLVPGAPRKVSRARDAER
jgi:hypothetical protein